MPITCPTEHVLAEFLIGALPMSRWQHVSEHVDGCSDCQSRVESLTPAPDTIISAIAFDGDPAPFSREAECHEAVGAVGNILAQSGLEIDATEGGATETFEPSEIGPYLINAKLGVGGMGTVYKAIHRKLKKAVAIKILPADRMRDEKAVARFQREMELLGGLEHENVVRAMDAGERDGFHFLVMEYVEGADASKLGRLLGPLPIGEACDIARQAAIGLQAAVDVGLIHRDIKPSNLMVTGGGKVKIVDFGLARLRDQGALADEVSTSGDIVGTADYMAPEQAYDTKSVDIRADIYSLGCTLYRLLSGKPPFSGTSYDTPIKKVMGHERDPVPPLRDVRKDIPSGLAAVVNRMMAKSPNDRYSKPADVADALAPFANDTRLDQLVQNVRSRSNRESEPARKTTSTDNFLSSALNDTSPEQTSLLKPPTTLSWTRRHRLIAATVLLVGLSGLGIHQIIVRIQHEDGRESTVTAPKGSNVNVTADGNVDVVLPAKSTTGSTHGFITYRDGTIRKFDSIAGVGRVVGAGKSSYERYPGELYFKQWEGNEEWKVPIATLRKVTFDRRPGQEMKCNITLTGLDGRQQTVVVVPNYLWAIDVTWSDGLVTERIKGNDVPMDLSITIER